MCVYLCVYMCNTLGVVAVGCSGCVCVWVGGALVEGMFEGDATCGESNEIQVGWGRELEPELELSSLNVTEGECFAPDSLRLTASLFSGVSLILGTSARQPASQGKLKTLGRKQ